jgi:hypothetical protein
MSDQVIRTIRSDMDRLRGRLFELVESWGLEEKRETAMKGMVRRLTYDAQTDLEAAVRSSNGRPPRRH